MLPPERRGVEPQVVWGKYLDNQPDSSYGWVWLYSE